MIVLAKNSNKISLVGDFTSKPQNRNGYVEPDDNFIHSLNLNESQELLSYLYDFKKLKSLNVNLQRIIQCKTNVNNYGNR